MAHTSSFRSTEDFAVLVVGSLILFLALVLFFGANYADISSEVAQMPEVPDLEESAEFKTISWYEQMDARKSMSASNAGIGAFLKKLTGKPGTWSSNPLVSFGTGANEAARIREKAEQALASMTENPERLREEATIAEQAAAVENFQNPSLNQEAKEKILAWRNASLKSDKLKSQARAKASSKVPYLLGLFVLFALLFGMGHLFQGVGMQSFVPGFLFVFLVAVLSHFLAGQESAKTLGVGYAAWAIVIGLIISNTVGTPGWVRPALSSELYIKTGLIVLGAEILFGKILAIGLPGIFVSWFVTPVVLITTFWFGQKVLKIGSKTLNMTISADMSVCGVSAAVATAAACKATKEELTLAVGLSMIFTSVMMIVLPLAINAMGLPEVLGGAWIGGTIDATGAVVAAGAFLGEDALNVAATIKMIQNILIGVIAFGVAIYFSRMSGRDQGVSVGWGEIWKRFPKFILGFIGASILFSVIYAALPEQVSYAILDQGVIGGFTKNIRGWLFCIAFVSIGLSTNFKELKSHFTGGKPLILYVCGQGFNLILTLAMAYIMFYLVFPHITENI